MPVDVRTNVPLAPFTTFGIGGPARRFVDTRSGAELAAAVGWGRERGLDVLVLGRGSNVLVGDRGFDGLVVRTAGGRIEELPGGRLRADAGVPVARLLAVAAGRGLSGLEHFAGIPSSLGGALWQNLHFLAPDRASTVHAGDLVDSATVLTADGPRRVDRAHFAFGYDSSSLQRSGEILLDATLLLRPGDPRTLERVAAANLVWRALRHPVGAERRSAGCVFRNPPGGSAARLVDAAGLRGLRIGDAAVSSRHANFVLNLGRASAAAVRRLVERVRADVERRTGVALEPEIAFRGSF